MSVSTAVQALSLFIFILHPSAPILFFCTFQTETFHVLQLHPRHTSQTDEPVARFTTLDDNDRDA